MNRPAQRFNTALSTSVFPTERGLVPWISSPYSHRCNVHSFYTTFLLLLESMAQQALSADPFLLADRAYSLSSNCSVNYHCAKQVPVFLDAALTQGKILQHSSAL